MTTVTGLTYSITGLSASTTYTFTVKAKDAAGNLSVASNAVAVTTSASTITYCTSTSNNTSGEKIAKVVLGTINNTSTGTAGYENFTSLSTNLSRGSSQAITITPSWTSTVYSEGYAVWIDYNKNGLFTDAGELVFSKAASKVTPATGTITIPATAALGLTRMRVSMKYNGIPTSCETLSYGQVEDYNVNITASSTIETTALSIDNDVLSLNLYPNPVESVLNVSMNVTNKATYRIYNMIGQEIKTGNLTENEINVSNFKSGVYIFEVKDEEKIVTKKFLKK